MNELEHIPEAQRWKLLLGAAVDAAESVGYSLTRLPGRGRYSVFLAEKSGKKQHLCVRTSRDRFIAFPPMNGGKGWKTLDDVDQVVVATVDSKVNPRNIEVFILPATEVRKQFNEAYRARKDCGVFVEDKFGFWVGLDKDDSGGTYSFGSGLADDLSDCLVAVRPIKMLVNSLASNPVDDAKRKPSQGGECESASGLPQTIADVMAWAKQQVASIAGVDIEAVRLDMKVEY